MVIRGKTRRVTLQFQGKKIEDRLSMANKKNKQPQSLDPKYFWGRLDEGLPRGTIKHSARNLFAHFDDSNLHKRVRYVFDYLAQTSKTGTQAIDLGIDRLIGNLVSAAN
jgi:hypothetical protein